MKIFESLIILLMLCSLVTTVSALPEEFDETGTDILTIGDTFFGWLYKVLVMLMMGMSIVAAIYIIKDSASTKTDGKTGASGLRIAKGIILACVCLLALPFIINML